MEIQDMNQEEKEQKIKEILESFSIFDGKYKKEEVDAAIELKEEITPHLIKILENIIDDPHHYSKESTFDHIYAVMLLGHFKEPKAHKVIVDIFSLPPDLPHCFFGEILTSDLPTLLVNTCDGSVELIKSLIVNKEAYDFCRGSASEALAYAAIKGYVSREEVLTYLSSLFTGTEAEKGSAFWGVLANTACDLYPAEIIDTIRKGYNDGIIDPMSINIDDFEHDLKLGKDKCLEQLKRDVENRSLDDFHASMSWWACFREKSGFSSAAYGVPPNGKALNQAKKSQKKITFSKKKKKLAKDSKKKNRRK
ncbi:MAG: DUF1186 domain-containing protein [Desulfobacterium sp.]|nr:DUF1186 domain-containing protein [Desulfobacterium sp.]